MFLKCLDMSLDAVDDRSDIGQVEPIWMGTFQLGDFTLIRSNLHIVGFNTSTKGLN